MCTRPEYITTLHLYCVVGEIGPMRQHTADRTQGYTGYGVRAEGLGGFLRDHLLLAHSRFTRAGRMCRVALVIPRRARCVSIWVVNV